MEYRIFGRTGLLVSVVGLGGGGASQLGLASGGSEDEAVGLVQRALDLGINYFDTATGYLTEGVMGRALDGHRDEVVISSKARPRREDGTLLDGPGLREALEASLKQLRTDVIDVYHLHRVSPLEYKNCADELIPELEALKREGKMHFVGISESTSLDATHDTLRHAVRDRCWDVMMAGFNLFNQSARNELFPKAIEKDIGIEIMAAARTQFSRPELFAEEARHLVESARVAPESVNLEDPLHFLENSGVSSLTDVSYRLAAYEPGVHVVLIGTGNPMHLEENVRSITAGPLPAPLQLDLVRIFGHLAEAVYVPGRKVESIDAFGTAHRQDREATA